MNITIQNGAVIDAMRLFFPVVISLSCNLDAS